MATPAQIRAGLAANLATIADTQISAYPLASPTPPAIQVSRDLTTYHQAMQDGLENKRYLVQAFVGLTSDIGAYKKLDLMVADSGATSVKAAIESDRTLGGLVDDLTVTEASGERVTESSRGALIWSEWTVEVMD